MPRIAFALLATLALVLPAGAAAASPDRARWRRPLPGAVVASFSFDPSAPYERGRRRGTDFEGAPGDVVVAACSGVVTYAGAVPRWGRGVTLRCGGLIATELGLGRVAVRRGQPVLRGALVGRLARTGTLRLGARRRDAVHGYLDPESLLAADPPWGGAPAGPSPRRWAPRRDLPRVVRAPVPAAASAPASAWWPAWVGLALVGGAVGGAWGGARHSRARRARRATEPVGAHR